MIAHGLLDRLWRGEWPCMTRKKAYLWMKRQMNMTRDEAHIGRFTAAECERLIAVLRKRNGEQ